MIGYGYWSPNLIRNIKKFKDLSLVAICEKDESRHSKILEEQAGVKLYRRYQDAFADPDVKAVVVSTAVSSHYRIAKMALEHDKHVLIEKPMAMKKSECKELVALGKKRGKIVMVDHTFLYSSAIRKLRDLISEGELGEILLFDSLRLNLGLFQKDINALWDLAPHDFSLYLFLIGKKITHVSAHGAITIVHPAHSTRHHSNATIHLYNKKDLVGSITVSWMSPIKTRVMTIVGTKKMAVYNQLDSESKLKIYEKSIRPITDNTNGNLSMFEYTNGPVVPVAVPESEDLEVMISDFLSSMKEGRNPLSTGKLGLQVVTLLEAAHKSLEKGGIKVSL